ncbi:uncharacterized protein [Clytia hemisphaerica]|uniref:Uncharacterized protein n=1 Tax=Clytia hemisphaerica TaxID=252671 RepID=A0A7M5XF31_9CNID
MEGTLKVLMLVMAVANLFHCSPVVEKVIKQKETGSVMLPSEEIKVLSDLTKYFSTFTEDLLSFRNGHMTQTELKGKYLKKTKPFPKRLMGLVNAIHSYYLKNLDEVAPPVITENKTSSNQTSVSGEKMKSLSCYDQYCISGLDCVSFTFNNYVCPPNPNAVLCETDWQFRC